MRFSDQLIIYSPPLTTSYAILLLLGNRSRKVVIVVLVQREVADVNWLPRLLENHRRKASRHQDRRLVD